MFTGIVEGVGDVLAMERSADVRRLTIRSSQVISEFAVGGSIAVDGVCLTIVEVGGDRFGVDVGAETLRRTTLKTLVPGHRVNLERPLRLDSRLGGHLVQGHVDDVGTIVRIRPEGETRWMEIRVPQNLSAYVVEKGSIAVDGISLTVARVTNEGFAVSVIPHTLAATTIGSKRAGDDVNIEVDIVAKYIARLAAAHFDPTRGSVDDRTI